jgi:glycosyltransferase involved in cell wall biosynthesis
MDLAVVIPVRNAADTLGEQLDALLGQRCDHPWEIVVVDNGSDDGTAAVVVDASDRTGINHARNGGARSTVARSVVFCDGDDIVADGWVAAMRDALVTAEFVTGRHELDRLNPSWVADMRGRGDQRPAPTFFGIFPTARGGNFGIRRALLGQLGGFAEDPAYSGADDIELSLRAWLAGVELVPVPEAVLHYRYRSDARSLWRQGTAYGRPRPLIRRRLIAVGRPAPHPLSGWRSWVWLVLHLPVLRSRQGRARWTWVAANRWGQVLGSVRYRCVLL